MPIRSWLHGERGLGIILVLVAAIVVAGKNLLIGLWPDGLGGDSSWALFVRNGIAAGVVVFVTTVTVRSNRLLALGVPRSGGVPAWMLAGFAVGFAVVIAIIRTFRHGAPLSLGRLAVVALGTGLLEELIFRGGLQSLAIRARHRLVRVLVPGLAFGTWHIIDGMRDAQDLSFELAMLFVAGTVLATAAASWLVLEPLRLRSRSIFGPALLHAAVNSGLLALGLESTSG